MSQHHTMTVAMSLPCRSRCQDRCTIHACPRARGICLRMLQSRCKPSSPNAYVHYNSGSPAHPPSFHGSASQRCCHTPYCCMPHSSNGSSKYLPSRCRAAQFMTHTAQPSNFA
jgi:hypothetical protein